MAAALLGAAGDRPWPLEPPRLETKMQKERRMAKLTTLIKSLTAMQQNLGFKKTTMVKALQLFAELGLVSIR
jgi:hypothetical protein